MTHVIEFIETIEGAATSISKIFVTNGFYRKLRQYINKVPIVLSGEEMVSEIEVIPLEDISVMIYELEDLLRSIDDKVQCRYIECIRENLFETLDILNVKLREKMNASITCVLR